MKHTIEETLQKFRLVTGAGSEAKGTHAPDGAYLTGAYLADADLTGAYLTGADLTRANRGASPAPAGWVTDDDGYLQQEATR